MTSATVDLTGASPAFNFKSGTGVYQNQTYTPMFSLEAETMVFIKEMLMGIREFRK